MAQGLALECGEAHLWVSLRETPCDRGPRPLYPCQTQSPIARTVLWVCYPSLRTPSSMPSAFGGRPSW